MEICVFKKVYSEENLPLRLDVSFLEDSINFIILQNENAWRATVNKESLRLYADQFQFNVDTYCGKLMDLIKAPNSDVIFVFKNDQFTLNRILENSLKVKFFTCKLEKVNYVQQVEQIMDKFSSQNLKISDKLNTISQEKNEIEKYKNYCESKLKELIHQKQIDENEQFGRFVLILNEKKRRIQHLTELLEAFKKGRSPVNLSVSVGNKRRKNPCTSIPESKKETISESEDSNSSQIIEESDSSNKDSTEDRTDVQEPKPSTSSILEDDFPQSHILPKRIRQEKPTDVVLIPIQEKSPVEVESEEKPHTRTARNKSPTIDISTQQLLDML